MATYRNRPPWFAAHWRGSEVYVKDTIKFTYLRDYFDIHLNLNIHMSLAIVTTQFLCITSNGEHSKLLVDSSYIL